MRVLMAASSLDFWWYMTKSTTRAKTTAAASSTKRKDDSRGIDGPAVFGRSWPRRLIRIMGYQSSLAPGQPQWQVAAPFREFSLHRAARDSRQSSGTGTTLPPASQTPHGASREAREHA